MCTMIEWKGEGMLDQQKHLSERVPEIILKEEYPEKARHPETCLCPVDVPETLDRAGEEWQEKPGIPRFHVYVKADTE